MDKGLPADESVGGPAFDEMLEHAADLAGRLGDTDSGTELDRIEARLEGAVQLIMLRGSGHPTTLTVRAWLDATRCVLPQDAGEVTDIPADTGALQAHQARTRLCDADFILLVTNAVGALGGEERDALTFLRTVAGVRHVMMAVTGVGFTPEDEREEFVAHLDNRARAMNIDHIMMCSSEEPAASDLAVLHGVLAELLRPRSLAAARLGRARTQVENLLLTIRDRASEKAVTADAHAERMAAETAKRRQEEAARGLHVDVLRDAVDKLHMDAVQHIVNWGKREQNRLAQRLREQLRGADDAATWWTSEFQRQFDAEFMLVAEEWSNDIEARLGHDVRSLGGKYEETLGERFGRTHSQLSTPVPPSTKVDGRRPAHTAGDRQTHRALLRLAPKAVAALAALRKGAGESTGKRDLFLPLIAEAATSLGEWMLDRSADRTRRQYAEHVDRQVARAFAAATDQLLVAVKVFYRELGADLELVKLHHAGKDDEMGKLDTPSQDGEEWRYLAGEAEALVSQIRSAGEKKR